MCACMNPRTHAAEPLDPMWVAIALRTAVLCVHKQNRAFMVSSVLCPLPIVYAAKLNGNMHRVCDYFVVCGLGGEPSRFGYIQRRDRNMDIVDVVSMERKWSIVASNCACSVYILKGRR
jgi:hypothetical protein